MNRLLFTVLLLLGLLLMTVRAGAQIDNEKLFRVGAEVSLGPSLISYPTEGYEFEQQYHFGLSFGFVSDFLISDNVYITTGFDFKKLKLDYSMPHFQEFTNSVTTLKSSYTGTLTRSASIGYFEIPVSLKYFAFNKDKFHLSLQLGFELGFNYSAKANDSFEYIDENGKYCLVDSYDVKIQNEVAGVKASVFAGVGFEYEINKSLALFSSFLINVGTTNILSGTNTAYPTYLNKAYPYSLEFLVGVLL